MDLCFDDKGDIDRDSFLVEVKGGKQVVVQTLPPLTKKSARRRRRALVTRGAAGRPGRRLVHSRKTLS
jgi:hypothetical protein